MLICLLAYSAHDLLSDLPVQLGEARQVLQVRATVEGLEQEAVAALLQPVHHLVRVRVRVRVRVKVRVRVRVGVRVRVRVRIGLGSDR